GLDALDGEEDRAVAAEGDGRRDIDVRAGREDALGDGRGGFVGQWLDPGKLGAVAGERDVVDLEAILLGNRVEGLERGARLLDGVIGVELDLLRRRDPERALDLVAHLLERRGSAFL